MTGCFSRFSFLSLFSSIPLSQIASTCIWLQEHVFMKMAKECGAVFDAVKLMQNGNMLFNEATHTHTLSSFTITELYALKTRKKFSFGNRWRSSEQRRKRSICDLFRNIENESVKNSSQTVQSKSHAKLSLWRLHLLCQRDSFNGLTYRWETTFRISGARTHKGIKLHFAFNEIGAKPFQVKINVQILSWTEAQSLPLSKVLDCSKYENFLVVCAIESHSNQLFDFLLQPSIHRRRKCDEGSIELNVFRSIYGKYSIVRYISLPNHIKQNSVSVEFSLNFVNWWVGLLPRTIQSRKNVPFPFQVIILSSLWQNLVVRRQEISVPMSIFSPKKEK